MNQTPDMPTSFHDMIASENNDVEREKLCRILTLSSLSKLGRNMLYEAQQLGFHLIADPTSAKIPLAKYNQEKKLITVPTYGQTAASLVSLSMSLCGIIQDRIKVSVKGHDIYPLANNDEYTVDSQLLLNRIRKNIQLIKAFDKARQIAKAPASEILPDPAFMLRYMTTYFVPMGRAYTKPNPANKKHPFNSLDDNRQAAFRAFYKESWVPYFDALVLDRIEKLASTGLLSNSPNLLRTQLDMKNMGNLLSQTGISYMSKLGINFDDDKFKHMTRETETRMNALILRFNDTLEYCGPGTFDDGLPPVREQDFPYIDNEQAPLRPPHEEDLDEERLNKLLQDEKTIVIPKFRIQPPRK